MQTESRRAEQIGHHSEQISITTAIMQNGFDADLLFDENRRRLCAHSRLCARSIGNIYRVNARINQKPNRIESFLRVTTFRRQNFDRS